MIMNCAQYTGKCVCGREHTLETKMVVVEYNAIANFEKYMEQVGLAGKRRTVVYDTNVYRLTEGKHIPCDQEIVLDANGLRSEDILIERMMKDLDHPEVIVAFGAGTIMDFGRYPAYKLGIPFVAVPTLASSDGFTANICSVILEGQKKSIPMCAPILVVADLDIIKGAPARLVASGINDILALAEQALAIMRNAADVYADTGIADIEAMTMAQMLSGLTMQLLDHSRAASGAEHLIAHLVEMKPPRFETAEGIHGECVGVGTYLCAKKYHELAVKTPKAKAFEPLTKEWIHEKFGERLEAGIIKENSNDILTSFDPQVIVDKWEDIRNLISTIPSAETLEKLYRACGCRYLPEHIGIDPALSEEVLPVSAAIRNRLTLVRMLRVLDFD